MGKARLSIAFSSIFPFLKRNKDYWRICVLDMEKPIQFRDEFREAIKTYKVVKVVLMESGKVGVYTKIRRGMRYKPQV